MSLITRGLGGYTQITAGLGAWLTEGVLGEGIYFQVQTGTRADYDLRNLTATRTTARHRRAHRLGHGRRVRS